LIALDTKMLFNEGFAQCRWCRSSSPSVAHILEGLEGALG
jgi:hypothetical protein